MKNHSQPPAHANYLCVTDRSEYLPPQELDAYLVRLIGPEAAKASALMGSTAVYMTFGGQARNPRDYDLITTPEVMRYLRRQPGWQEGRLPGGQPALRNGRVELGCNDGSWPALQSLQARGWKTNHGLTVAGLPDIYAWKQQRDTLKDRLDTAAIRHRLLDPALPPLPAHVMPSELALVRDTFPEHLRDDPDAHIALRLATSGFYIVSTLYGDERIRRANQIIGALEQPEYGTVATYHHGFHLREDIRTIQRHLDNVEGVTDEIRMDAAGAETYSDAAYGNGRRKDNMPGGHDELRSANLAYAHAIALGYSPERAAEIREAILDTEFDEATGKQRGANTTSVMGRALAGADLQSSVDDESAEAALDLSTENDTSARWNKRRTLGKVLREHGVRVTATAEALAFIDAHPNARPSDAPDGPTVMESLTANMFDAANFRDPGVNFGYTTAIPGWTLDIPAARVMHAAALRRIGQGLQEGTLTATQAFAAAQRHTRWMQEQKR